MNNNSITTSSVGWGCLVGLAVLVAAVLAVGILALVLWLGGKIALSQWRKIRSGQTADRYPKIRRIAFGFLVSVLLVIVSVLLVIASALIYGFLVMA